MFCSIYRYDFWVFKKSTGSFCIAVDKFDGTLNVDNRFIEFSVNSGNQGGDILPHKEKFNQDP